MPTQPNPFEHIAKTLDVDGTSYKYYSLQDLNDPRVENLPYTIRVLLESALRNADEFVVKSTDVENILNWTETSKQSVEIPFLPARVILQDFTGVPCVVDLAAMRDAVASLGGDPKTINPLVPVDLVVDHSVQVDSYRNPNAIEENLDFEMKRNAERFQFLKWGATAFNNLQIVPPGSGIVHQVNLEYLARVVFANETNVLYPDSLVGTDSHTTMINGLGVTAWGVGGIEAEAVMLGQHVSMVLPEVVGFCLSGSLPSTVSATDLVLQITSILRKHNVVGKFVEFYGPGIASLSLADRATIANMAPEYGATQGFFPFDQRGVEYLRQTGRSEEVVNRTEAYLRAQNLFLTHDGQQRDPIYSSIVKLDLSTVVPTIAGPKRPHDAVFVSNQKKDFNDCLKNPIGFKGYDIPTEELKTTVTIDYEGTSFNLTHGSVVIAAITSCTNTSNPSALIAAGLLARNAIKKGLQVRPYIKTSLAPGSHVATKYLEHAGLTEFLDQLGFNTVAFGCTTCIGNSGDIPAVVETAINNNNLVASAVLSGNRNFEGRVHPSTRANYLASPALVVAYALAGTVDFDFETEPLTYGQGGQAVYLRDIWPSKEEITKVENESVLSSMFKEVYKSILNGTAAWNALKVEPSVRYNWDEKSTYIHNPPYFQGMGIEPPSTKDIKGAYCLLNLGDSITTDHISPAGKIAKNSPAAVFLQSLGVAPEDFNSYGSRRGNDLIMMRGTFANTRIVNKLLGSKKASAKTLYVPTEEEMYTYDAAEKYKHLGVDTIVFGGQMYGSGSSRDWAAKGPFMLGVRTVIAQSFERIHRSNLVGMGLLPLEFMPGESADALGLTGKETYSIDLNSSPLTVQQIIDVKVVRHDGTELSFKAKSRIDTEVELEYFKHGGILNYVIRKILKRN